MKFILFFVSSLISFRAVCQEFGIIDDKDGYVNIRQGPTLDSKIIGRIFESDIFFFSKTGNGDWFTVEYGGQVPKLISEMEEHAKNYYQNDLKWKSNSVEIAGYVHKTRIVALSSLVKLNGQAKNLSRETFVFKNDTLSFQLELRRFNRAIHRIEKGKNGLEIDGHRLYGLQSEYPNQEIKSADLVIRSKEIPIPISDLQDLYEFNLSSLKLSVDKKGVLYIYGFGSDGFSGYSVFWIVKSGKYLKREIGTS